MKKANALVMEFVGAGQEHARFFGSERKTGQKTIERALAALSGELSTDIDDVDRETELRLAKKKVEIVQSAVRHYQKGHSGFVNGFKDIDMHADIDPKVNILAIVPRWMLQERFKLQTTIAVSTDFWTMLQEPTMIELGFAEGDIPSIVSSLIADRLVEIGRRESTASLPGIWVQTASLLPDHAGCATARLPKSLASPIPPLLSPAWGHRCFARAALAETCRYFSVQLSVHNSVRLGGIHHARGVGFAQNVRCKQVCSATCSTLQRWRRRPPSPRPCSTRSTRSS